MLEARLGFGLSVFEPECVPSPHVLSGKDGVTFWHLAKEVLQRQCGSSPSCMRYHHAGMPASQLPCITAGAPSVSCVDVWLLICRGCWGAVAVRAYVSCWLALRAGTPRW
jgi:hypothetical protein